MKSLQDHKIAAFITCNFHRIVEEKRRLSFLVTYLPVFISHETSRK